LEVVMRSVHSTFIVLFAVVAGMSSAFGEELSFSGMMLTPTGIVADGTLVTASGKITSIGPRDSSQATSAAIKLPGIILPGFIDLHDHLTWNVQPRWLPGRKYYNRYEWQDAAEYDRVLSNPHYAAMNTVSCEAEIYAEIKALAGGATSALGGLLRSDTYVDNQKCVAGLVRNLDTDSGFTGFQQPTSDGACPTVKPETDRKLLDAVENEIFPLELTHDRFDYLLCALANKTLRGLVVHLSEGANTDSAAHREYSMLSKEILLGGTDGKTHIARDGLAVIHGTALRDPDFPALKASNVGLIWSPRSNDELYGSTTNIASARLAGLGIAIAPDWSPSGSAGMLQELGYASRHYGLSSGDLVSMATSAPAKLVRIFDFVGALSSGLYADFVVLDVKVDPTKPNPLDPVTKATPANVALVVVGGEPIYGDEKLLTQLRPNAQLHRIRVCGADKAVDLTGTAASAKGWKLADIQDHLKKALEAQGTTLAEIECD
jgi:5-methylthioadenosine/S-adenosylhomocysteine deaminase